MMFAQFLRLLLNEKFGENSYTVGANPVVTFAPADAQVGELHVYEVGKEARVHIGALTHGHFYSFGNYDTADEAVQELAENVFDFICDLFAEKFVVWRAKSAGQGEFFYYDASGPLDLPVYADKADWFFWSGPININHL